MAVIQGRCNKRKALLESQNGLCWLCGTHMAGGDQTFDHLLPVSKGGTQALFNLRLAHKICNSRRGSRVAGTFFYGKKIIAFDVTCLVEQIIQINEQRAAIQRQRDLERMFNPIPRLPRSRPPEYRQVYEDDARWAALKDLYPSLP